MSPYITEAGVRRIVKNEVIKVFLCAFSEDNNNELPDDPTKNLSFSEAFNIIRNCPTKGMRLPSWSKEVVIRVQNPDKNSKMTHPYLYAESRKGNVPWRETFPELFSNEWEIVDCNQATMFQNVRGINISSVQSSGKAVSSSTVVHSGDFPNTTYTSE